MNHYLSVAGGLSALAALMHLGCIYFGAPWYRVFGAGEQMALMAERGSYQPTLITLGIFCVLMTWSVYAFSAAGLIGQLPMLRAVLVSITCVYAVRGVGGFFFMAWPMGRSTEFWYYSSVLCLMIALVHFIGLKQQWDVL
ncbi:hypothetical protein [Paraglaciecola polaris]|uniref:Uncharacterized protein n=1 Tax=Paraglaciecola polaris LMG 21857 TaxID=1129793 RepID=K6YK89_9ALTE|nr:hypothetical protein [Paraglaciecola polaris]GAC33124.1 hypothetical protein GPLA_2219 [Paraglaciecola polaris LMG 21857]|tara:strand:+ start:2554 stop:2973 length:420 start_codon:yes stop_codon:yes gene_type:complete